MEFGMVCNKLSWEEKSILDAAKSRGVKVNTILNTNYYANLTKDTVSEQVILQRSLSYVRGLFITAILENFGHTVINSYKTSELCGNKLLTSLALIKAGIPTPKTYCAFTDESALEALNEVGYPAVIKPVIGSWGRMVALLKDQDFAKAIIEEREVMGDIFQKIYYFQEYVFKPARNMKQYLRRDKVSRDFRVFTIGDEVIAMMGRHEMEGDWRSTATRGARTESISITPEIRELALKAAKVVEGDILGIDVIEGDQLMVNEINHVSGFQALANTTGIDVAGRIVDYLIKKMKK